MSHIRFNLTPHGTLQASVQVMTESGIRTAMVQTALLDNPNRFSAAEGSSAVQELLRVVDLTRDGASKARTGGK